MTVAAELRAAIHAWEKRVRIPGHYVDLTVARRHLGRTKGYVVRLLCGQEILREWKSPGEQASLKLHMEVMQALAAMSGFHGIVGGSDDDVVVTADMLDEREDDDG